MGKKTIEEEFEIYLQAYFGEEKDDLSGEARNSLLELYKDMKEKQAIVETLEMMTYPDILSSTLFEQNQQLKRSLEELGDAVAKVKAGNSK